MTTLAGSLTVIHGGALGDLVLTLHLARAAAASLRVVARVTLDGLTDDPSALTFRHSDAAGVHWLYGDGRESPAATLADWVRGQDVLWMLSGADDPVAGRLRELGATHVWCVNPTPWAGADGECHIVEQWRRQLAAQDARWDDVHVLADAAWSVTAGTRERGRNRLGAADAVVLHAGSGGRRKCWPLPQFIRTADALRAAGRQVAFVLGPVEAETWLPDALEQLHAAGHVLALASSADLVAVLAAAAAYVGNDAGPTHLAAALGTPTFAIFGPTDADVWQPLGPRIQVLRGTPAGDSATWGLTPADVAAAVLREL